MAKIVSPSEWQDAHAQQLKEETEAIDHLNAITAKRQQFPMVEVQDPERFKFDGPNGNKTSLVELFSGRKQLIIYNFMLYDNKADPCVWCSFAMDHIPVYLGHLNSRETSFVVTAPASADKVMETTKRMGWTFPFYGCKTTIADAAANGEEMTWKTGTDFVGYAAFLKEGDRIFHTYSVKDRPTDLVMSTIALLDMTKLGRQENGEDRPFPLHDQY